MELLVQHVLDDGGDGANEEEEGKAVVHLAVRELALRTNDTPDDGRRAEDGRAGAGEAALGLARANALDVREQPRLHAKLHSAGDDGRNDLAPEHRARGDLHVVAELEILRELQGLSHGDVAPGLDCD